MTSLSAAQEINNGKNKSPFKVLSQDIINEFFEQELKDDKKKIKKAIRDSKKPN